jgi:hypothetical protein
MSDTIPFSQAELQARIGAAFIPISLVSYDGAAFWCELHGQERWLSILASSGNPVLARFNGTSENFEDGYFLLRCRADQVSGHSLRSTLPWLQPVVLGLATSTGFGDRLGLATMGQAHALQRVLSEVPGSVIAPIFAQQSIREMQRTGRKPEEVLDDATWGAFQAGWHAPLGADADHLKTFTDIDNCTAAGYTFYTIDSGAHVDSAADEDTPGVIQEKLAVLPWDILEDTYNDLRQRYAWRVIELESRAIALDELAVARAAAKYGRAVAHVVQMYRHLAAKGVPFELEISVDETETPTTPQEHAYLASELKRLGIQWVSLAPRYVGRFEKGIDYIGDLDALRQNLQIHAEIARASGPYKLGLHSGSDKFSVYPLISQATRGLVHLKTAGTSYVEALRVVAQKRPGLFRDIIALACARYPLERASYHVSAEVSRVPDVTRYPDEALAGLLDEAQTRQVVHVTFGSVLATFGSELKAVLQAHPDVYEQVLDRHFYRHLLPFAESSRQ